MTGSKQHEPSPFAKLKPGPSLSANEVAASQRARIQEAMIQIVAANGYGALKMRDVVKLAQVSTRSFYQHFDSKEDCFLRTYAMVVDGARIGLIGAQMDGADWRERPRQIFIAFARGLEENTPAARLALIDIYAGGPAAIERAHSVEANFVSMLAKSFERAPGGMAVPPLVIEGIASGVARVARTRLLDGSEATLDDIEDEMMEWALCFPSDAAIGLATLDLGRVRGNAGLLEMRERERAINTPGDDRATIIAAISKLCAAQDFAYVNLTVPVIRGAAGVSRRTFDANFDGVEECFLAALDLRAASAIADAATEQTAGAIWEGGIYRAISSLCTEIAGDPLLARVAFQNDFLRGSRGAQARLSLIAGVADQIRASAGVERQASRLATEASTGAIWALFHHHVLRDWAAHRPNLAATLAYIALTPLVGAVSAESAIRNEQIA